MLSSWQQYFGAVDRYLSSAQQTVAAAAATAAALDWKSSALLNWMISLGTA
jgi:hypothetical protein